MASISQTGTFSALRHTNFKLYFGGQLVSITGTWMQALAQGWLVYYLTQSEGWLGIVACAAGAPSLILSPFAGVVVDRFRRRDILLFTQTLEMTLAFVLAWLTLTGTVQVWHVVVLALLGGILRTLDAPARQAFIRDLVGMEDLDSGVTLNSLMVNGGRIIGPAFAGALLATVGAGWCFFLNGATFLAVLLSLVIMRVPRAVTAIRRASPLAQMREGVQFSRGHITIAPLILMSAVMSLFAVNMVTVLPAFAAKVLNSPIDGYSVLSTAQGIGAVVGALGSVWLTHRFGHGWVVSFILIAISVVVFLLSRMTSIVPAAVFMGLMGACYVLFFVNINTLIQKQVPDEFRGRVMSLFTLTFLGLTPFGALAMGFIAESIGTPNTMALYGLLNGLLGAFILLRWSGVHKLA
ncbi:MAG: MFS transporter [Anaerolineae bacterium]|nr:MFS transporter [Anaerolineae bacterium]